MSGSADNDIYGVIGKRLHIGVSAIIGITIVPGQNSQLIKYFTGGSLEIGGATLTWGIGYLFGGNEAVALDVRGTYYLCATGATATVMLLGGKSMGFEG